MPTPVPNRAFLQAQIRWAMGRGLPAQAAEDVVFEAWEKAASTYDPARGAFEAYMQRIVRNATAYWWRRNGIERRAEPHLQLVREEADPAGQERAAHFQTAMLEALEPREREVFAAWALQKESGFTEVYVYEGGYQGHEMAGYPSGPGWVFDGLPLEDAATDEPDAG